MGGKKGLLGFAVSYLKVVKTRRGEKLQEAARNCQIIAEMEGGEGMSLVDISCQKWRKCGERWGY
jgi:hypothetical protein